MSLCSAKAAGSVPSAGAAIMVLERFGRTRVLVNDQNPVKEYNLADDISTIELATELTVAWLSNSNTRTTAEDVPSFLKAMRDTLDELLNPSATGAAPTAIEYIAAVSVRKSLASPDHIISMIDGKPYKALRRHLSTNGMTPDQYRERYNLKADYPMVAPSYSESRRAMARKIGLGRKPGQTNESRAATAAKKAPRAKKTPVEA